MEGISHETISLAGHLRLSKLIVRFDDNAISIDGSVDLACSDDQLARFSASGWATERVDGHDPDAVARAIATAQKSDRPSLIACRTTIRSEERRVGKECVSTCRSRGLPEHSKKKNNSTTNKQKKIRTPRTKKP